MFKLAVILLTICLAGRGLSKGHCMCADGGDNCLSPRVFEKDLIGYFSFDKQLVFDDSGSLKMSPNPIPGPGYGLTTASLYSSQDSTYKIAGDVLKNQEALTISFWIYLVRRGDGWTSILKKGDTVEEHTPSLSINNEDGTVEVVVSTSKEKSTTTLSNGALQTGRWNHIALSISLNAIVLYFNGFVDIKRNFNQRVKFNPGSVFIGMSTERMGAEMFIDELKFFNSFLSHERIVENMGGDNVPFGMGTAKLSCLDCTFKEAFNACQEGYHMSSIQELIGGGYQLALSNGWNKMNSEFWSLDPNSPNVNELKYDTPLKKAAICFKDKV